MTIHQTVDGYVQQGLTKDQIVANLKLSGYTEHDINEATAHLPSIASLGSFDRPINTPQSSSGVNNKSLLVGILFIGLGVFRLSMSRGGNYSFIWGGALIALGLFRVISAFAKK